MIEAREELIARGVIEVEPASDSRAEGQELGGPEALGQTRIAGEDDAEELFGIELLAGENAELAKDRREGLLGLVDDEDGCGGII